MEGPQNIAANYPENSDGVPELGIQSQRCMVLDCNLTYSPPTGPRIHAACGERRNRLTGTTPLHADIADSVNCVTWAKDSSYPAAIWHIFPRESVESLRHYLGEHCLKTEDDPIEAQTLYVTDDDLHQLSRRHNIVPWTIEQAVGDMIVVPAGCVYQVQCNAFTFCYVLNRNG